MNPIRDELEKISFSEQEKNALAAALTAARQPDHGRPMPMAYRRIIALVAAVSLLIGAVGAVSVAGVSPAFRRFFGIETTQQEENLQPKTIHQVYEDPNGTGAVLTVEQVLMDSRNLYVTMELAAPEGMVLPEIPEAAEQGKASYWIAARSETAGSLSALLSQDAEATRHWENSSGVGYGIVSISDDDGSDGHVSLLFTLTLYGSTFDETCQYLTIRNLSDLRRFDPDTDSYPQTALDGFNFSFTIPLEGCQVKQYDFQGRSLVHLGGETLLMMENLSLSPISIGFDLLCGSKEQYDALSAGLADGGWPVYVLLRDGSHVKATFPESYTISSYQGEEQAADVFFSAASLSLHLEHPIDPAQVQDIIFVGDNGDETGRNTNTSGCRYFSFDPNWRNDHYWNEINQYWMDLRAQPVQETPTATTGPEGGVSITLG